MKQNKLFPFFRKDTLTLDEIFKEAKVYFNHVKFTIKDDIFRFIWFKQKQGFLHLMKRLSSFKQFVCRTSGMIEFIRKPDITLNENLEKLKENIKNIGI